jgi:regulator of nucleoside diphosphate kinase
MEDIEMSRKIYITQFDKDKLLKIINKAKYENLDDYSNLKDLETELIRADVTNISELPSNVITMNTKAVLLVDGIEEEVALVYPNEADILESKLSVLSPIGTAILGYSEGDIIEWKVPKGIIQVKVEKIIFQPEALGLYDL